MLQHVLIHRDAVIANIGSKVVTQVNGERHWRLRQQGLVHVAI